MDTDKHRYKKALLNPSCTRRLLKSSVSICVYLWLISFFAFAATTHAQVRPVYDRGAVGLMQLLKRLNTTASVLMIGAHPDDEDSALLAYLARGENARTAYLSLTRGDGGQNIIGPELFESLGVIRTEELLQARRLDGAEQYFTRAFDYGFSKTLAEARQKWDEKVILCDTVRAIRTFRPLVVISRFSGTPADGHGQHQFAGYISPLAVKAAADPSQCYQTGQPWQVLKYYVSQGFRSTAEPNLKINTGEYDFLLGRSYFEIAMEGRSQHKTQEQGNVELRGDRFSGLNLIESKAPKVEGEKSVFDGIDTSIDTGILPSQKLTHLSENEEKAEFSKISEAAKRALNEYQPSSPPKILPVLLDGLKAISRILRSTATSTPTLHRKQREFAEAIQQASGIRIDVLADRETVVLDETFVTAVNVYFPKSVNAKIKTIALQPPKSWTVDEVSEPKEANQISSRREIASQTKYFNVRVGHDAKPTEPYWLENERVGDLFNWDWRIQNVPFQPALVFGFLSVEIEGTEIHFRQPIEYRFADEIRGEIRRNLNVVPKISLRLDHDLMIFQQNERNQPRQIKLTVTNNSSSGKEGEARLSVPRGWRVSPNVMSFSLQKQGEKITVAFDVSDSGNANSSIVELRAEAKAYGEIFTNTMHEIAYPHIQTHRFYTDAKAKIMVLDLRTVPAKIGYIMGSGDEVPETIRQMGLSVTMLEENDLASGDLTKYDSIVVGIRASETRRDFVSNNQRLLDYVKSGGNLIVQYQRPSFAQQNILPFPATMGPRVVDENAKVTLLQPDHPVFNFPNKITDADFAGWVQERNLYNFSTMDEKYVGLLEAHDTGEPENKGGLVIADVGKGKFVYCSYSFFRQLPAGVGGAYRLFANMLSLPKSKK